jgi:hypothetical protein
MGNSLSGSVDPDFLRPSHHSPVLFIKVAQDTPQLAGGSFTQHRLGLPLFF